MSIMWPIFPTMTANSASVITFMGKESFTRMAQDAVERHLAEAAEAERNNCNNLARNLLERALAIEEELARIAWGLVPSPCPPPAFDCGTRARRRGAPCSGVESPRG